MTQIPAGWYPDPDPDAPEPRGSRYWDGQNWTEHVQPAPGQAPTAPAAPPTAPPTAPAASYPTGEPAGQPGGEAGGQPGGYPAAPGSQAPAYAPMSPYAGAVGPGGPTTPDGQALSGWGRRAGALVIDWIVVTVATGLIGYRWVSEIGSAYVDFFDEVMQSPGTGGAVPGQADLIQEIVGPVFALSLLMVAISFVYNVALWKWRAATLGQMAFGIKVRLREQPGPLSWGTVLLRWLGKQGYKLVALVPLVGILANLYALLNYLWPLWDDKNQALHDKLAKTNVVRT
jgi:uncharacterized RDD family membrane protein YckC